MNTVRDADGPGTPKPLRPAQPPRARYVGLGAGIALVALAVAGIRELVVWCFSPAGWDSWIAAALEQARTMPTSWSFWGGIGLFLVGLWLVVAAFMPRLKPYLSLTSGSAIWVRRVDLARYVTATAKTLPGVLAASTLVTKKRVVSTATVAAPDDATRERIHGQLRETLIPLVGDRLELRVVLHEDEEGGGLS